MNKKVLAFDFGASSGRAILGAFYIAIFKALPKDIFCLHFH